MVYHVPLAGFEPATFGKKYFCQVLSSVIHMINQVVDIKDIKKRNNKRTLFLKIKDGKVCLRNKDNEQTNGDVMERSEHL